MNNPFPGMNPYLEHPSLWAGIHHRVITAIANDLGPKLRPKYIVAIEERVYEVNEDVTKASRCTGYLSTKFTIRSAISGIQSCGCCKNAAYRSIATNTRNFNGSIPRNSCRGN